MNNTLISVGDLLSHGWAMLVKDWKRLFEISIRFLISNLIVFLAIVAGARTSESTATSLILIAAAISFIINLHTTIVLVGYILKKDVGADTAIDNGLGWRYFLPAIWISIIEGLAVLGGFILFFFPGIWLAILFAFALFTLLDENKRGTQALARSAELVKGRWWKSLWRLLVPAIVVMLIAVLLVFVVSLVLGLFTGFDAIAGNAFQSIMTGLMQIVLVPLSIIYEVKLYHSLKASR